MSLAMHARALRAQQLAFQSAVLGEPAAPGLLRPGPSGQPAAIAVYQHAYGARLRSALRDNFEILAQAMGDDAFDALAAAYIEAQPSTTASIRWFGHRLARFMDQQVSADGDLVAHPALADMARMDWALRDAFDAVDAPVLQRDALAGLPAAQWPALKLALHPTVQRLALRWAVEPAWLALRLAKDGLQAGTSDAPELAAPEPLAHELLVWRQGLDTRWRSLPPDEAALLQALAEGRDFSALCALAAERVPADQALPQVVGLLQQWLADGLLRQGSSG